MPEAIRFAARQIDILICLNCGRLDPGPRELCPACGSDRLAQHQIEGRGKIVSWTIIRRPPARFRSDGPYVIVVVDLDADVRVTGRLNEIEEALELGSTVMLDSVKRKVLYFTEVD